MKPGQDEVVYMEDLPEGTIIEPHAFKPKKGVVLKIGGIPVGTCDVDIDEDGSVTYTADFQRDKISPELYEVMFGRDVDGLSMPVEHTNVFDEDGPNPDGGQTKPPFRLPGV